MREFNTSIVTLVVLAAVFAGCAFVDYPESATVQFGGDFETDGSTFRMTGPVFSAGPMPNHSAVFHDVSIGLYAENGTKLCTRPIGDVGVTHGQLNVSLSWHAVPHYVTLESPEFWSKDIEADIYANAYENRGDGEWREIAVSSPNGYPVDTTDQDAPTCGG